MKTNTATLSSMLVAALWFITAPVAEPAPVTVPPQNEDEHTEQFSQSYDVGPEGSLTLGNVSGDIVIRGDSGNEIQINAVKRVHDAGSASDAQRQLEEVRIDVSHTGNRVRVHTRYGDRHERKNHDNHVSVDFEVTVPFGTEVSAKSVSGDVDVEDVQGELKAVSVSGEVTVAKVENLAVAKSVSGSVEVESATAAGGAEISSVSGDVDVTGISGSRLDVASVSGDVELRSASCDRASMESVSGDIRYSGAISSGGRYEFKAHSGDVRITIPGDVGFELEAETFSGEIESDFPLTVSSVGRKQTSLSGVFGDGSAYIEATTFSGDVTVRQK